MPTPACSPASSTVVAPSTSTSLPEFWKVMVPPSPPSPPSSSENRSRCSWSESPASSKCASIASSIGPGPQAQVSRSRQSGQSASSSARLEHARRCRCGVGAGEAGVAARQRLQLVAEDHPLRRRARSSARPTSGIEPRRSRVRSIDITGVIPLPATRNSGLRRRRVGQHEVTVGQRQPDDGAGREPVDEVLGQEALGHRPHGDGDRAARTTRRRADRVGAPLELAADLDADADVLPGLVVVVPAPARADHQRRGVLRLRDDLLDPSAQLA